MQNSHIIFIFLLVVGQLHQTVTALAQHSVQLVLIEMNVVSELLGGGSFCFLQIQNVTEMRRVLSGRNKRCQEYLLSIH